MLTWHFISRNAYELMNDSLKTPDKLFFVRDDKSILNGTSIFSEDIILYNRYPTTIIGNKVYININTLEGMVCVGNSWDTVINPVIVNRTDYLDSDDIKSIAYDSTYNHLVVTKIDDTEDTVELSDLALDMNYNDGNITFTNEDCHLSYGRKIKLSDFINQVSYNPTDKTLTFGFKNTNAPLVVSVGNVLDKSNNVNFTVTGNSFIAECLQYYNNTNEIVLQNDVYVVYRAAGTGISTDVVKSTIAIMTKHMATIADSSSNIMTTVGFDKADQIIIADDEGNAKASGVKISEQISEVPSNKFVPTEKAVADYLEDNAVVKADITSYEEFKKLTPETATDRKLASERTLLEQMSWGVL